MAILADTFQETIKKYRLINKGDRIIIGASGGPDSTALIYLLSGLKKKYGLFLHITHVDHQLRRDSHADAEFVSKLAAKLGIPSSSTKINISKHLNKGSIEETARNARFKSLFDTAKRLKINKIALGHNLDDQAETVLMRLLRGAGLSGLSGILPQRKFGKYQIIRPLIGSQRKDIETFLKKKKIRACQDSSNLEDIYFRNKIRLDLIPFLENKYSHNIKTILSNMAENVGNDYDYLSRQSLKIFDKFKQKINLVKFLKLHPALQRMILRLNITLLKDNTRRITSQHIRELEDLIFNRPINSIVDLPGNIAVAKKKKTVIFYLKKN